MTMRIVAILLLGCLLSQSSDASNGSKGGRCQPKGTWLLSVAFESGEFQFQQLLSLHQGGTLTETNGGLHSNSFPDPNAAPLPPPAPPALNGSDGRGAWKRLSNCTVQFSFLKLVFAGANPVTSDEPPAGTMVGYLKVSGLATIQGDLYQSQEGTTTTQLLFGPDPNSPFAVIDFGNSGAIGYRLLSGD